MTQWAQGPEQREQLVLFTQRLDDALPPEHSVRQFDEILSQLDWSAWEAHYHGRLGQPAIHPRVLAGVLSLTRVGYDATRVRASNRRSGTRTPDELRQERDELAAKFEEFTQQAAAEDARDEELFESRAVRPDDADSQQPRTGRGVAGAAGLSLAGGRPHDRPHDAQRVPPQARRGLEGPVHSGESTGPAAGAAATHELPAELRNAQRRREQIDATLQELAEGKAKGRAVPRRVPTTDLNARVMPNKEGGHAPNYTPLATVDIDSGLIVHEDVLNEVNEDGHLIPAVEEVQRQYVLQSPPEVLTDGLNGTGANLAACEERGISIISPCPIPDPAQNPALRNDPTQPVPEADWDRLPMHPVKGGDPQLDKTAFVYDEQHNCYWCPQAQPLTFRNITSEASGSGRRIRSRYQAEPAACAACPLRSRCLQGKQTRARTISREQYEAHRERHAQKMATPEAQATYARRRHPGERPFAVIKHQFGLRRFLLRRLERVRTEWRWGVTAFNLLRLMSLLRTRAGPALAAPSS